MTKELQDLAWRVLPKEFKEEVKKEYRKGYVCETLTMLITLFGHHNLTSDAEGEDEMLCVSRKDMQFYYQYYKIKRESESSAEQKAYYKGRTKVLLDLFGSKCLPDNVATLAPNVDSLSQNPTENCDNKSHISADCNKPAEPKFKVGDMAVVRGFKHPLLKSDGAIVTILSYHEKDDFYSCAIAPNIGIVVAAKYLEPYAEPKNKDSVFTRAESVKEARIASEESHLSNSSQDCDERFDTIIKRGFRADRRCNIAVQMIKAMMSCPEIIDRISSAEADSLLDDILHDALYLTDNLIAECEKGDNHA